MSTLDSRAKNLQTPIRKAARQIAQNWLIALIITIFAGILFIGAPAWAAPVQQGGTVPDPTPTSSGDPVPTATPRPDDDDDNGGSIGDDSEDNIDPNTGLPIDPSAPNITFPTGPGGAPVSDLTAVVNVNGLNMRDGPGTNFNALGNLPANTQVTVLARSEDGTWWYVCCLPGTQTAGWVSAQLLTPNFDGAQANALIPIYGTTPDVTATPVPQDTAQAQPRAEQPLEIGFRIQPYFVWQGITATLTITVNNPNNVDAVNVLLSDELPEGLELVSAEADANGTVENISTSNNRPLLLFRWESIPADTAATATIVATISPNLPDGAVIDNLVAARGRNVPYSTGAVTIGMPPVVPPNFQ